MKNNVSNIVRYTLVGTRAENMSTIEINYYIQKMCELYGKIEIINRLNRMLSNTQTGFVCIKPSTPISEIISLNNTYNYKIEKTPNFVLGQQTTYSFSDKNDIQLFFNLLKKVSRPEVFLDNYLLFDYYGEDSLKLKSLTYNSPPSFIIDTLFGSLEFMADERRKKELHELDKEIKRVQLQREQTMLIGEREKTIREVGYNKSVLENPNVSPVAKAYIRDNTQYYQDKISQLNDSLGIEVQKIDILT